MQDFLTLKCKNGIKKFQSRLIVGTGKYKNLQENRDAVDASGAEMVTVAVRRVNIEQSKGETLQDYLDPKRYTYLPNTAGCYTANDARRTLELARDIGGWELVKLEVLTEGPTLYPDMTETIIAAKELVGSGFDVMVYTNDDPIACKALEECGCVAIMPLGAPIGSGLGLQNKLNISFILQQSSVPVIVDAGVGTASDATIAMELGCDGVLMNSAIAYAQDPILMASSMKLAVQSGRLAHIAGMMEKKQYATSSTSMSGKISN